MNRSGTGRLIKAVAAGAGVAAGVAAGVGARLRRARVVHPSGVVCTAVLTRLPGGNLGPAAGLLATALAGPGPEPRHATVRLSKALGTGGAWPDLLGMAIRLLPAGGEPSWDLLLATAGGGRLTRYLLWPARDWSRAAFTSLLPYRADGPGAGRLVWAGAVPTGTASQPTPEVPASLAALRISLAAGPLTFIIVATDRPLGGWQPVASLTVSEAVDLPEPAEVEAAAGSEEHIEPSFDPVLNHHPLLTPVPHWLAQVREGAYAGSRHGRHRRRPRRPTDGNDRGGQANAPLTP